PSVDSLSVQAWLAVGVGVTLIACIALAVAVMALAREVGMLRLQLGTQGALEIAGEGPEVGSRADELVRRLEIEDEQLGLAVFTSEGCHVCQTLAPAIESVGRDPLVAVRAFDEVAESETWNSIGIPGSPFAVALGADGTVLAKGTFNNLAQLESVLATADRRRQHGIAPGGDQGTTEGKHGRLPIGASPPPPAPCLPRKNPLPPRLSGAGEWRADGGDRRQDGGHPDRAGGVRRLPLLRPHLHHRVMPASDRPAQDRLAGLSPPRERRPGRGRPRPAGQRRRSADRRPGPAPSRSRRAAHPARAAHPGV